MKPAAAATAVAILALLALPFLATPAARTMGVVCGEVGVILDTIRTIETGGNYTTRITTATASGAYAMIDSAWRHWSAVAGHPGWAHAWQAPPPVQDATAAAYVTWILERSHGDVALVPVYWYLPAAVTNPALMDRVPMPEAGNRLTPRQYQARWLDLYHTKTASATACDTADSDGWALPVDRSLLDATPSAVGWPHHDYPAWDFPLPPGSPIYAMRAGTVVRVTTWPGNCHRDRTRCGSTCGIGVTVQDDDGTRWTYCHGRRLIVTLHQTVTAGTQLLESGNSGHSSGPHLHLGIRVNGIDNCPQPLLTALHHHQPPPPPAQLPTDGCTT